MKYVQVKQQGVNSVPGLLMTNVTENIHCSGDAPASVVKWGVDPMDFRRYGRGYHNHFYIDCQFPPCTVVQHHIVTQQFKRSLPPNLPQLTWDK